MNIIPKKQQNENTQKAECVPSPSERFEKNFVIMKVNKKQNELASDEDSAFTFAGNISPTTAHGKGPKPRTKLLKKNN